MVTGGLYAIPENGGTPRRVCKSYSSQKPLVEALPVALPDGETLLFTTFATQQNSSARLAIASLSTGKCTLLDIPSAHAMGVLDGLLIYATAEGALMAAPFDLSHGRATGPSTPVLTDIEVNQTTGAAQASLSANGTLVYASGLAPV